MEETLDALIDDFRQAETDAESYGLPGKPKAIYVSQTNIVEGNAYQTDNPKHPFLQRQAPPILISSPAWLPARMAPRLPR